MPTSTQWRTPGRSWEFMLLTTVLAAAALGLPDLLPDPTLPVKSVSMIRQAAPSAAAGWHLFSYASMPWIVVISLLYAGYLFAPNPFIPRISLSLFDLFAPLLFTVIAYARMVPAAKIHHVNLPLVGEHAWDILVWLALICVIIAVAIALRAWHYHLKWRTIKWDLVSPTLRDGSFRKLAANLYPIVYPPQAYRLCPDGLLILGRHYVMPIPLRLIESVRLERHVDIDTLITECAVLATSTKNLLRLGIRGIRKPVFISPKKSSAFLLYLRIARSQMK